MSKPPKHAYELLIRIGGNNWEYLTDALEEIAIHVKERGENCSMASGGYNGSHSVDIFKREISPEDYRKELAAWSEPERAGEGR